ncbi:PadR family transcriptional regulator [Cytobacillus purgationiresistens]|uniref:PadR family transcriptional regulator PadR n=1 Tax=Cytobacillus purgationiresistens TaxID=863449 RepID=A0ABU0AAV3_9BACI|nr:PadR family transcriptional regulator [Cytobacillus purgationiresistens]MDQ0268381.1 PadR family transcriptional regulator PadR [Cytobacillus purgationiresistens]
MKVDKEILRGYIDTIILSLLYDRDLYGYDLSKEVKKKSGDSFELKESTLYLSFKRLEKNGYVISYWQEGSSAARRKYYHLTVSGSAYLLHKKEEWKFMKQLMENFLEGID